MILNIQSIYIKYLKQANKINIKYKKIYTYILRLKQKL